MGVFVAILALAVNLATFLFLFFYVRSRTAQDALPQRTREAVREIINEIDRITDRDSRLVEERIARLKAVLEEVDRRIFVIEREVAQRARTEDVYRELGRQAKLSAVPPKQEKKNENPAVPPEAPERSRKEEAVRLAKAGLPSGQIAARLGMTVTEVEMAIYRQ
jgi:hypothetical protein